MQHQKFVSVKRQEALDLLEDEDYTTEVRKVGRHWFVRTDAPLQVMRRTFYDSKGRMVDNGPDAVFSLELDYSGEELVSASLAFVD